MLPLYSDKPLSRFPYVSLLLIAVNIAVFWQHFTAPGSISQSVILYGMIPYDLLHPGEIVVPGRVAAPVSVVTSMFSHGGFLHLGSNMLYLWVFGRNVEDFFGHFRFLVFYMSAGILAGLAFAFAFPNGNIPLVGASGAVAGTLGVYFLKYPLSRIYCLLVLFIFVKIVALPAFVLLGFWFALQIVASMSSVSAATGSAAQGGVAWISHVAGFVVGIVWTIWEFRRQYYMQKQ